MQQLTSFILFLLIHFSLYGKDYYISPDGSDDNPGTKDAPFATLDKARDQIFEDGIAGKETVTVHLFDGYYFLDETFKLHSKNSGTISYPVIYQAENNGKVIVSGAVVLEDLKWKKHKNGIYRAVIPEKFLKNNAFDELWLDDMKLDMARYPNNAGDTLFGGITSLDILESRAGNYRYPTTGFIHALHNNRWGSVHYRITGISEEGLEMEGAWQHNLRPSMRENVVMIENIFEELDHPGEWYLDRNTGMLYVYPPVDADLNDATPYAVNLKNLVQFEGNEEDPVKYIDIYGIEFRHARRVFMDEYEPLLRGDWSIQRSAAVFMEGTENCIIRDCFFNQLGGNGVFMSNYNRYSSVIECRFEKLGESAVCFVGNYTCTRSNPINFSNTVDYNEGDSIPGANGSDYPAFCKMGGCLVFAIGRVGKQTAGAFVSMSENITISHNTIYHVPRSGITINDGCWGGHVLEYNHIFNTVMETGDHGPFNSWGRDRYWKTRFHGAQKGDETGALQRSKLDNHLTTIIRHNRFEHNNGHSWGIDLDDGSSNYHIYNNICLGCAYKLREGFYRLVENNITIGASPPGKHVCFMNNQDIIRNNIHVSTNDDRIVWHGIYHHPLEALLLDYNIYFAIHGEPVFHSSGTIPEGFKERMTLKEWSAAGRDIHSLVADPMFMDPMNYDFRVREGSPALKLGFKNFPMDQFGVQAPQLKELAEKGYEKYKEFDPAKVLEGSYTADAKSLNVNDKIYTFLGAKVKDLNMEGEKSVAGVGEISGVFVIQVPESTVAETMGMLAGDAILSVNGKKVIDTGEFFKELKYIKVSNAHLHMVGATDRIITIDLTVSKTNKKYRGVVIEH